MSTKADLIVFRRKVLNGSKQGYHGGSEYRSGPCGRPKPEDRNARNPLEGHRLTEEQIELLEDSDLWDKTLSDGYVESCERTHLPLWICDAGHGSTDRIDGRVQKGETVPDISNGFGWKPGFTACTTGIWIWSEPFVFEDANKRKVATLIMDTQGAHDDQISKTASRSIFGLTVLLSGVLIYNIPDRIGNQHLAQIDEIMTIVQAVVGGGPGREPPCGHLHLLSRDWSNFKEGWTMKECDDDLVAHLRRWTDDAKQAPRWGAEGVEFLKKKGKFEALGSPEKDNAVTKEQRDFLEETPSWENCVEYGYVYDQTQEMLKRLRNVFRSLNPHGSCHPGDKVKTEKFRGKFDETESDFIQLTDAFMKRLFSEPGFPQVHAPNGVEMAPHSFRLHVERYARLFEKEAGEMPACLRDAFVDCQIITGGNVLQKDFDFQLNKAASANWVVSPVNFAENGEKLLHEAERKFRDKLKPYPPPPDQLRKRVEEFMNPMIAKRNKTIHMNAQKVDDAKLKVIALPVACYVGWSVAAHSYFACAAAAAGGYFHYNQKSKDSADVVGAL